MTDSKQTGSDVTAAGGFLLDVVVADALSADDTLHERREALGLHLGISDFNSISNACHLADSGEFGEEHLEDWRRKRLLQDLEELLRLTAHGDRVRQMIHTFLVVT